MFVTLPTARIFFDVVGPQLALTPDAMQEKPTLIVLHGGPGYDHSTLRPYFDRFADTHQVVYIDHRGCGRSSGEPQTWHLDQWADDIAAVCAQLGIVKPAVFGQSFGGMVAMHYAARHPDGPSKVILSSTAAQFRLDETEKMMRQLGGDRAAALAVDFFTTPSVDGHDAYNQICLPLYSQADQPDGGIVRERAIARPEVAVHFFADEMKRMDLRAELAAITCPVLVMGGAQDPVTPPVCAAEIARAIGRHARLKMFEACGHGAHRDHPEQAAALMQAFLDGNA